jgi:hypothetical protein
MDKQDTDLGSRVRAGVYSGMDREGKQERHGTALSKNADDAVNRGGRATGGC